MSKDICFCADRCDRTGCFRNRCHVSGIITMSYLRNSEACPKNRSYYGSISDEMLKEITQGFALDFLEELRTVFKRKDSLTEDELFDSAGTNGWQNAFDNTCSKHHLEFLTEHTRTLDWQAYDIFTAEISILCAYWRWVNGDRSD